MELNNVQLSTDSEHTSTNGKPQVLTPRQNVISVIKDWDRVRERTGRQCFPMYGNWLVPPEMKAEVFWELQHVLCPASNQALSRGC
jgi:hypothetical protein